MEPQRFWGWKSPGVTAAAKRCKTLLTLLMPILAGSQLHAGITALHPDGLPLISRRDELAAGWQHRLCPAWRPRNTPCPALGAVTTPQSLGRVWETRAAEQVPHSHVCPVGRCGAPGQRQFPFLALSLGRRTSISGCRAFLGTARRASASISSSETDLLWVFIFLLRSCRSAPPQRHLSLPRGDRGSAPRSQPWDGARGRHRTVPW